MLYLPFLFHVQNNFNNVYTYITQFITFKYYIFKVMLRLYILYWSHILLPVCYGHWSKTLIKMTLAYLQIGLFGSYQKSSIFFIYTRWCEGLAAKDTIIHHNSLFLYARLKNGRNMPSRCPHTVRLPVRSYRRPSSLPFFQHAVRYLFETFWPTLQPKVYLILFFLYSCPYNLRLVLHSRYLGSPVYFSTWFPFFATKSFS